MLTSPLSPKDAYDLRALKNLRALALIDTGLSDEQVDFLRQELPDCIIEYEKH